MVLRNIYKSDINRSINGVIKVAQNDERSMEQELGEYIITKELRRHFDTFFTNYERSITEPTDKIGVWISGFFGSGKSHFLKMLSYLLSDKVVAGKRAVEYFADKFDDPLMYSTVLRCASVPTDTILFNIDSKSPLTKDKTAILRVFAKVFYEHCGFYGDNLKIARLEQYITRAGKMEEFKSNFSEINGGEWENARDAFEFFEDDIVAVLQRTPGMSETSARNWFNGTETEDISIDQLVREIKEYIDSRGSSYRLLFMIDEVGQYIGSDSDLMLNLQTIVEEIGTRCGGRVWVMVTSQEAIDSITKISGDDFSKIQGRFNTRLSLSSSSVDEVIRKRILAKNENGAAMLHLSYAANSTVLKNLFTFNGAVLDLKGYAGEDDFAEAYPFVPYQFRLMQNVLAQIRKHGNSGKHLSGGERSMLSGFQEAAQAIQDRDENALVPFSLFYNTVHTFLESPIRRVIDRCQAAADAGDGIRQYDVDILKLLYLVRYIDDIRANPDNITTLMVDDIRADKINMRRDIQGSLDRLLSQNYISRNGDTYTFLTDDEQDIARDIMRTDVDSALIVQAISQTLFGEIYPSKKFRFGMKDFPFDQFVDETAVGQVNGVIGLRFVTVASDLYGAGEQGIIMKSRLENEAIVLLSDKTPYFTELESAMKIRKYIKIRNVAQLPEEIQSIIRGRQEEAAAHEHRAEDYLREAIRGASVYVAGELMQSRHGDVKEKLDCAMRLLVESVYTKYSYVSRHYENDSEIIGIMNSPGQVSFDGTDPDSEALEELDQYLGMQEARMLPTSVGDIQKRFSGIPYGWREIDIAALVARLASGGKIILQYAGSIIRGDDRRIPDYLRKRTEVDRVMVKRRVAIPGTVIKSSRELLREYFNRMDVPSDEDSLIAFVLKEFGDASERLKNLISAEYSSGKYPGREVVEEGIRLCDDILSQKKDNLSLLRRLNERRDDLLDNMDDMQDVTAFFRNQKKVFDSAVRCLELADSEREYLQADSGVMKNVAAIRQIITDKKPYRRISELPGLMQEVKNVYDRLLSEKRCEIIGIAEAAMSEIHQSASPQQKEVVIRADTALSDKKKAAESTGTMTSLDAMISQINSIRAQYLRVLMTPEKPDVKTATLQRSTLCLTARLKNAEDIENYLDGIREKLTEALEGNDVVHII